MDCGKPFTEDAYAVDVPLAPETPFGESVNLEDDTIGDIYNALCYGTRKFMDLCGVRRITVGISGGIDSSVAAALYRQIVDPSDLLLVNMPGAYTSPTTRHLALRLAESLDCYYAEIPIEDSVALTRRQIDDLTVSNLSGTMSEKLVLGELASENVQARDRSARILAGVASAFGGVFTCNANKSEATVGYTTLYGDLGGYLANLADLWKTEVYELAHYLNKEVYSREVIPRGSIDIVPSAELSPSHNVDERKGDPLVYPYHDCLFRTWVEWWNRVTPEEILDWYAHGVLEEKMGYTGSVADIFSSAAEFVADLERWWDLYQGMAVAKRIQSPPILAVKRRAFGFDHRESQMGARYTQRYKEIKERLIGSPNS